MSYNATGTATDIVEHGLGSAKKWIPEYYNEYSKHMDNAGLPVLSMDDWGKTYFNNKWNSDAFEDNAVKWRKEASDAMIDIYNTKAGDYATASGNPNSYETYNPEWGTDPDKIFEKLKSLNAKLAYVEKNKPEEAPAYKFDINELNEDGTKKWQNLFTIEEESNKALQAEAPTLSTDLVGEWENKIDPIYQQQKDRTTKNAKDVWGMMFGQEGGSTYEAGKLTEALKGIDIEKLNKAIAFAEVEQGQKYNTWARDRGDALNNLSSVSAFKAAQDQFGSSMDASNFWNKLQATTAKQQYYDSQAYNSNQNALERQYAMDMAKMMAEANASDPWSDLATGIVTGGVQGLAYGLAAPRPKTA